MSSASTKTKTPKMPDGLLKRCPGYKLNFQTLCKAVENDDVCLMACVDKATGKDVAVICAVSEEGNLKIMIPLAKMFDGNPYDELIPPGEEGNEVKAKSVRTPS